MPTKAEIKKSYVHYFQPADPSEYPQGHEFTLINSLELFERFIKFMGKKEEIAVDTETTSLDITILELVGMSFSVGGKRGFYLPFRHKVGKEHNLPLECLKVIYEEVLLKHVTRWFNFQYDAQVLEKEGFSVEDLQIKDIMNLVWIADTNVKKFGLKISAKHFLGWDVQKFEEILGTESDFSYVNPEEGKMYACTDALATYGLWEELFPVLRVKSDFVIRLDNKLMIPLLRYQQEVNYVDDSVLEQVDKEIEKEAPVLEKEIYKLCDRVFDLGSPTQLAAVLESMNIDTGERGKTHMKTGAEFLEKVDHPVAKKIVTYNQITTWRNNFIKVLRKKTMNNKPIRFNYFHCSVPTARLSSGKDKYNPEYYTPINIQAIVKPEKTTYYARKSSNEEAVLGWEFNPSPVSGEDYPVSYNSPKLNIRNAFAAPKGWIFCKFDYSGEEMRIPANLSGEKVWLEAFRKGEDLHSKVAITVFGEATPENRQKTKAVNFGILYGSTAYSFARKFSIPVEEAERFYSNYKSKHRTLFNWIDAEVKQAKRTGVTYTAFGRPRRLHYWFSSPDRKVRAFAERSCPNSIIQGSAGDILRISLVNLYYKVFKVYPQQVRFRMTVHDEVDVIIKRGSEWLIDKIQDIMTIRRKDWAEPMMVGVEAGTSWGSLVEFEKEDGVWVPKKK